jgi:hypothetical protein
MKYLFLASSLLLIGGCATNVHQSPQVSGETVVLRGLIDNATAREFRDVLRKIPVSRVLIASGGGNVEASIEIASEIFSRKLDVEVVGDCFSSCANYIFPAGATKTISGLGLVAWHGNMQHLLYMHSTGKKPLDAKALVEVQRLVQLESAFFTTIGLDPYICWFGKLDPYSAPNLYFLDIDDMARFGLSAVRARPDYAKTDLAALGSWHSGNVRLLRVDWSSLPRVEPAR